MKKADKLLSEVSAIHGETITFLRETLGEFKQFKIRLNTPIPIAWYNGRASIFITHCNVEEEFVYTQNGGIQDTMKFKDVDTKVLISLLDMAEKDEFVVIRN